MSMIFKNKGLIDLDLIETFGVSAKPGDNPIGYFGTGLKYAIAILLRNKYKITLLRGKKVYIFESVTRVKRGKRFQFVTMNGKSLGFTTHLGANWEIWMAFREMYSNCADEEQWSMDYLKGQILPKKFKGFTQFVVQAKKDTSLEYILKDVLLDGDPLGVTENCDMHEYNQGYVYYKGIRIYEIENSVYSYNLKLPIALTEDRTVKYTHQVNEVITNAWKTCTNEALILEMFEKEGDFEKHLNYKFDDIFDSDIPPSKEFINVVGMLLRENPSLLNKSAKRLYTSTLTPVEPLGYKPCAKHATALNIALVVLDVLGIPKTVLPNIQPVIYLEQHLYIKRGDRGTLYISKECLEQGANIIMREICIDYYKRETAKETLTVLQASMQTLFDAGQKILKWTPKPELRKNKNELA